MSISRRPRGARLTCLLLAAGLTGCGSPTSTTSTTPPPRHVFLITVDTLRADHLSSYGYARSTSPRLDRLASESTLFEHAIAQWPKTGPSFASLFTGRYPSSTGLTHRAALRLPDSYLTLPELFQRASYATVAVVSNAVLSAELGWNQGFDEYLETWKGIDLATDDPVEYRRGVIAPRVNELALPVLRRHARAPKLFVWLHYSDPHAPYTLPSGFGNPFLGDSLDRDDSTVGQALAPSRALGDERRLGFYVAHYDANILVADRYIGEALQQIEELGLLEDALVIFTSDHGEGLGEHDEYFEHGRVPYNTTLHVPLLIRRPGGAGGNRRLTHPVELVDLYPTLRDLLAADEGVPGFEGDSLRPLLETSEEIPPAAASRYRYAFSEAGGGNVAWRHYRSVQTPDWKLVFHPEVERRQRRLPASLELYHLATDPLEEQNLAGSHERQFQELWQALSDWMLRRASPGESPQEAEIYSDETVRALRALGYLD